MGGVALALIGMKKPADPCEGKRQLREHRPGVVRFLINTRFFSLPSTQESIFLELQSLAVKLVEEYKSRLAAVYFDVVIPPKFGEVESATGKFTLQERAMLKCWTAYLQLYCFDFLTKNSGQPFRSWQSAINPFLIRGRPLTVEAVIHGWLL